MNNNTSDRLLELDNIRRQFKQECIVAYKGFVFEARAVLPTSPDAIEDRDGYPVPLSSDDSSQLHHILTESYAKARKNYFERMGKLNLSRLTEVKRADDEETE
jgi:hypothetical protein